MRKFLVAIVLMAALPLFAQSSVPQPVQQVPSHLDVAQFVQTTATASAVLTITPPSGQYVYITNVEITNCGGATQVTGAAPTTIATTNLGGLAWTVGTGGAVGGGQCVSPPASGSFAGYLKSSVPGTNVTITNTAFATNQTVRVSVYYYFAP